MTAARARKYNPGFLSDDELVASFCVRTYELESMVEMLRECTGASNQHQIVIGPRGSGKTSLLLRVAAEVRRDADLAATFFPVVFAEESYEVSTAGEFWLECLARLADRAPEGQDAPNLHATLADLRTIQDDQMLGERCLAALLDFADREGKRLVLMVENLNMMFRDMMDRQAGWRLRKVLQTEPRVILLASATSRFNEIDQPDHALYDLFRVLTLRPMNTDECAALWETVSGQSRPTKTIRSLEILTGGSPRLLAIVARFGAGLSFRDLMDNLLDLVDDHTDYFKSHLESLPVQERRVYLALADLWKPAFTNEIAERARIATSKCSAQLMRLIERGAVLVAGGSARRKQYYLSERMYNIYYLLRRGTDRLVEVLIGFMAAYYSPDELQDIGTRTALEAEDVVPEMRPLYQFVSARLVAMSALAGDAVTPIEEGGAQLATVRALFDKGVALLNQNRDEEALAAFSQLANRSGEAKTLDHLDLVACALFNKGVVLGKLNRLEEGLAAYDEVLRQFGETETPAILEPVANALLNKSAILGMLKRPNEVLAVCGQLLRRFDSSQTPEILDVVANALCNKGLAFVVTNRPEEALSTFDDLLRRFGQSERPAVLEPVAKALVNKGMMFRRLNRLEDELAAYDEVVRRFGDSDASALLERVAWAIAEKLRRLTLLNRQVALHDIEALLRILPRLDPLPPHAVAPLIALSVEIGPNQMLKLIQDSPTADLLPPLTTALEREMGLNPRVPEEVGEVAEDIRQTWEKLRENRNA